MRRKSSGAECGLFLVVALLARFVVAQDDRFATVMPIKVDHVSVCGSELEPMRQAFASVGLATDYGGPHANGITHMALLGFDDGSYLELIAPQKPGTVEGSHWAKLMAGDAGPCAWAVGTKNIKGEAERLKRLRIETSGPESGSRKKPDGTLLQWETASVGRGAPGAVLPFMIQDKTPRILRVQPSASVKGSGLKGIEVVVLAVNDLDVAITAFRLAYGWRAPRIEEHPDFGAKLVYFPDTPVILAAPLDPTSWLAQRLEKFGQSPVAYLLGTQEFDQATKKFQLAGKTKWFGRTVAWFDAEKLRGVKVGVVN